MNKLNIKNKIKFLTIIIFCFVVFNVGPLQVSADSIFNLMGLVKYSNGTAQTGNASSPNSYANARAYRSNIDTNFANSNKPNDTHIYPAGYADAADPAYFLFDVGSSAWNPAPAVGDTSLVVLETYAGLNGWGGASYVAGVKSTVTQDDLNANTLDYASKNAVMEPIPTPTQVSNGLNYITIGWNALWDTNTGAAGGTSNNSIVGYSVYRNDNGGSFQLIGEVAQNAGQSLQYNDSTATLGHTYTYKIKVRFEWNAHSPAYYESAAESYASSGMVVVNPNPDRIAFTSSEQTINAGNKTSVITIQTRDIDGNNAPVLSDTTISLSSNSTGPNKNFYNVNSNTCGSSIITSVQIQTGSSTAQFCYYDDITSPTVWILTAHKSSPANPSWVDGTQNVTVHHSSLNNFVLNLESPQYNKLAFTGTNTLTAYDQYGNLINDFNASTDNITFSVDPSDGTIAGLRGASNNQLNNASDFVNGVANLTGSLKYNGTSGDHTFTATSDSGKVTISGTVYINPAAANHLSFSVPSNVTVGTEFNISEIQALDEFNNIDTNFSGTKFVSFTGASNGPLGHAPAFTTSVNFTNGVSTTTLATTLVKPETITLTATTQGISGESNQFTVNVATANHFGVSAPSTATAGLEFNLNSITAYDPYGNIDTNYSGTKTISYSGPNNGPTVGTPSYTTSVDFTNGVSTTTLATTLYNREQTSITANDGTISGGSAAITVGAGEVGSIEYVSGDNQSARINSFLPLPLVVKVKDLFGNLKDNYPVSFVVTKSNGFVSATTPLSISDGTATTNFSLGSTGGTDSDEVEARIDGANGSPIVFKATATQNQATNLVITAPNSVTAGTSFNINISVTDQNGDHFYDFNGLKTVSYSGPANSLNGSTPTYTTSVMFLDGLASNVPVTLVKVENVVLNLNIASDNVSGTSNAIQVNPAATNRFIVVAPNLAQSGVSFNLISITATDQFGNTTPSYSGLKNLVYTGAGVDTINGNSPNYTTSVNFTNGVSTTPLSTTLYKAENVNLKVKNGSIEGTSNTITVRYNQPYVMFYISGNNQTGAVGQQLANPLKVILLNSQGLPALDKTVVFTVITGTGTTTLPVTVDESTGEVSTNWTLGTTVGVQNVTATVDGISDTVNFSANAVADVAALLAITPTSINTFATHASNDITICLKDQYGNQVITNLVRTINLESTSQAGQFAYGVSGPWGITSADIQIGQSCVKVNYLDAVAGTYTFTASSVSLTSASIPLDVQALIPTSIVVSPTSFTVSESNTQHLTATVYDQFSLAMSNITVNWSVEDSNAGTIDSNGEFTPGHTAGTFTNAIKATYANLTAYSTPTVTLDEIPPVATSIEITPTAFTVNENNTQQLSATVYDQFNHVINGLTLNWEMANANAGSIDSNGLFTPSHTAGTYSNAIKVSYSNLSAYSTPTITIEQVILVPTSIVIAPASFSINENNVQQMSATVYDQFNQPMNLALTWSVNSVNAGSIDSNGLYTPSHTIGTFTNAIKVSYSNLSAYATPTITRTEVTLIPSTIVISPINFNINVNSTRQMSAAVYDQFSQQMQNINLTWSVVNSDAGSISSTGLFTPSKNTQTFANVIKVSYLNLTAFASVTITTEPVTEIPTTPVPPTNPSTPSTPTTPIVVEVGDDYAGNGEGTTPITVEVPEISILSPKQGALILSNGHVNIAGISIPNKTVVVKDMNNNVLGSTTSDKNGYWKIYVSRNKFGYDSGTITANAFGSTYSSKPLTFNFETRTFGQYLFDLIFSN